MPSYAETHARSLKDPEGFWGEIAEGIHWDRRWSRVLDSARAPFFRWFPGGRLNTCFNALDRHVEAGRGARAALIHDSPMTGQIRSFTFAWLTVRSTR